MIMNKVHLSKFLIKPFRKKICDNQRRNTMEDEAPVIYGLEFQVF